MPVDCRTLESQVDDSSYGAFHGTAAYWQSHLCYCMVIHPMLVPDEVIPLPAELLAASSSAQGLYGIYDSLHLPGFQKFFVLCRVEEGDCSPPTPTDPDMRN